MAASGPGTAAAAAPQRRQPRRGAGAAGDGRDFRCIYRGHRATAAPIDERLGRYHDVVQRGAHSFVLRGFNDLNDVTVGQPALHILKRLGTRWEATTSSM